MAFIGNTNTTQAFTPAVDFFSGNASTTAFTLSKPVASAAQVQAVIENVPQNPGSAFTVSGNTITFTSAPPSGTNNIYVYYTSPITQTIQPSQGTVNKTQLDVASGGAGTGAMILPTGTTAQRPTGSQGMVRMNSTTGLPEWYDTTSSSWVQFSQGIPYTVEYLVVAGGGGGDGGGGGAGGLLGSSTFVYPGSSTTVTIGAGGLNPSNFGNVNNSATSGSNSSFGLIATAIGGGAGRYSGNNGVSGGSGGGGGYGYSGGSGTSGQGFAGGASGAAGAGGGGGAGAVGGTGSSNTGGAGGAGTNAYSTWASATSTGASGYYAGGGGGGGSSGGGSGGLGGGGNGGNTGSTAGAANTGGGGGGIYAAYPAANGGSGIVIIRYSGSQRGTGGTVVSSGGYTYHTFTTSGTFIA